MADNEQETGSFQTRNAGTNRFKVENANGGSEAPSVGATQAIKINIPKPSPAINLEEASKTATQAIPKVQLKVSTPAIDLEKKEPEAAPMPQSPSLSATAQIPMQGTGRRFTLKREEPAPAPAAPATPAASAAPAPAAPAAAPAPAAPAEPAAPSLKIKNEPTPAEKAAAEAAAADPKKAKKKKSDFNYNSDDSMSSGDSIIALVATIALIAASYFMVMDVLTYVK